MILTTIITIIISVLFGVSLYKYGRNDDVRITELERKEKELENIRRYFYAHMDCASYYSSKEKLIEYDMVQHGFDSIMIGLMENYFEEIKKKN